MLLQPPTCSETDARAGGDRTGNKRPPQPNPARKALTAEHLRPQSPQDASRPDAGTLTAFFRKRMSPDRWKALRSPPRIRIVLSNRLTSTPTRRSVHLAQSTLGAQRPAALLGWDLPWLWLTPRPLVSTCSPAPARPPGRLGAPQDVASPLPPPLLDGRHHAPANSQSSLLTPL